MTPALLSLLAAICAADPLPPGDHDRTLRVDERERSYLVHLPPQYDHATPTPVVLILHGASTNAGITVKVTGMSRKADEAGFIAVYPNGTGTSPFLTWNAGGLLGKRVDQGVDDVKYIAAVLDDLATVINVDPQRIYATGISNGGIMCYRLAAELSDRIAAIAPVAGAMAIEEAKPHRPVAVLHFHGKADAIVPFDGPNETTPKFIRFKSVEESIAVWRKINECPEDPQITNFRDAAEDGTTARQRTYGPGQHGTEVILIEIEGGGHTWPGQKTPTRLLGKSTLDISANDLIWEFFQRHPLGGTEKAVP